MKSEEKWLTVCSFVFGLVAVIMIAMEYIAPLLLTIFGVTTHYVAFLFALMTFNSFFWGASIVLIAMNLIYNRDGIKTILGCIGMVLNAICFLRHTFIFCTMVRL